MTRSHLRLFALLPALVAFHFDSVAQQTYPSTVTVTAGQANGIVTIAFSPSYQTCQDSDDYVVDTAIIGALTVNSTNYPSMMDNNVVSPGIDVPIGPGAYSISGTWGGFGGYDNFGNVCYVSASTGTTSITVPAPENSGVSIQAPTSPVREGQSATITAIVAGANGYIEGPNPTGSVVLFSQGKVLATLPLRVLNAQVGKVISSSSSVTFSTAGINPGTYTIGIVYNGDTNLNSSASSATVTIAPTLEATSTALSVMPSTVELGQSVTLTATVTPGVSGTVPTGHVTFTADNFVVGTAKLNASGVGSITVAASGVPAGVYPIIAKYGGDSYNAPSSSAAENVVVQALTTTSLTANPSSVAPGQSITFTVSVARSGAAGTPTGAVNFLFDGYNFATATLNSQGVAIYVFSTQGLGSGNYQIEAVYEGDALDVTSTSDPVSITVH